MSPVINTGGNGPVPSVDRITVRNRKLKDPTLLDIDPRTTKPGRHYRWVRARTDEHLQSIIRHKLRGYQMETTEGGVKTVVEPDKHPDNRIAIGDLVLMSCPEEVHEERQRARKARTEGLLASTSAQTEQMAKEKGISLIQDADHNKVKEEIT